MHTPRRGRAAAATWIAVLGLLDALGPLSIDLYLPAFPEMQRDLDLTDGTLQYTLAGMTLGLALGQAFVGSWSDRVGRRTPLLASAALHLVGTVGCALAPSGELLIAARVAQGVGAAGSAVIVLALIRDRTEGRAFVSMVSRVTLITTTAPLLAPVVGAALLPLVGWRGIFAVLAVGSGLLLVAAALVVPDMPAPAPGAGVPVRERVRRVLSDRSFRGALLVASMTYAGVYAYVAASPLLLRRVYGLTAPTYALVFLLNSLGIVAGVQLGGLLCRRMAPVRVLGGSALVTLVAATALLVLQPAGLGAVLPCLWLFVLGCGGCFPGAAALALGGQAGQAGTASSVYGFVNFAAAGLISPIPGLLGISSATPVATVLIVTSGLSLIGVGFLARLDRGSGERPGVSPDESGAHDSRPASGASVEVVRRERGTPRARLERGRQPRTPGLEPNAASRRAAPPMARD